ncbi:Leucine-rich repeat domain, L domain-like [Phytophthora cactorum]|nr:Leucine-rich repeat domain, L domain-like [Phytophthora cactorum]
MARGVKYSTYESMSVVSAGAQLSSVSEVQDAARLLMQPRTSRRVPKVPGIQVTKMIILAEQHLTRGFGLEIFPFISSPVVSTSLTVLDLSFNELDDVFWAHWTPDLRETAWPALTTLNLANNQFSVRGLDAIATFISRCPSLTELDLSLNTLRDQNSPSDWIHPLIRTLEDKDREHLQVLDISCTGSTDSTISQLVQADFTQYITKLYLRSNALTDEAANTLGNALPRMKLEVLSLAGNTIGDCGAASLAFVLNQTPALQTLDIEANQYPSASTLNFNGTKVKRDILLECCLTDRYVHFVTQTLRTSHNWQHLEQLDLSGNEIGEKGAYDVGLFLALQPPLKVLNLSNNFITGLAEGLEPNAKLHELLLDHNQITDDGAKQLYLKAFKANQQRRIRLSVGNPLTSECKNMLAAISQAHDLRKRFIKEFADQEKLDLSGRSLRQYGVAAIVEELRETPSSKCRYLDLSRNGIGDEGAHAVATLLRAYPRLEELDLSFNDIGDEGAFELADALAENYTLVILSLHSVIEGSQVKPKLQEKGLCRLAHAIQNHKALQKLDLRNNATSSAVIRAYVEMLRCNQGIQNVGAVLFMIAMSSMIGFPLPFTLVVGIPVWFAVVLVCFVCCFGRVLRREPAIFKELKSSVIVLICQVLLTFVYPAYLYGFIQVQPSNQKFYLVLLPIIKIIAKNWISHFLGNKYDLKPQIMIFNVDVFNALYVSSSMQNSSSISTMLSMIGLDVVQAWVSISDIGHLMKFIRQLQRRIPAGHPLESASFIEITQQIIKEDSQAKAHLSLHHYSSALTILKFQNQRSVDSVSSVGASTDENSMQSRRVLPVATAGAPLLVAAAETFTSLHQDEASRRRSIMKDVFSPRERRLFVQRTAQVLFTTEFVILVEYTEVIVPFIFCMYTLAMYQLPNRAYYSQVAELDEAGLGSKLGTVVKFGMIELLSLVVFGFIIQRKIGVSMLRLLSFVLDRSWRMVQANLFLWIFYTVQNSLEHNGKCVADN